MLEYEIYSFFNQGPAQVVKPSPNRPKVDWLGSEPGLPDP